MSILIIDTRVCKEFGRCVHLSKSDSTCFIIPLKFLVEIENKEGYISTPKYLKLLTTGMCVGNEAASKSELRDIREDLFQLML